MQTVSKVTCNNNGGFVMKFRVFWKDGASGWTNTFPIDQSATIDLTTLNIPKWSEVGVEAHAELGEDKHCHDYVQYDPDSSNNATYRVSGTTLDIDIKLEGS
jgi:hypothetical protein